MACGEVGRGGAGGSPPFHSTARTERASSVMVGWERVTPNSLMSNAASLSFGVVLFLVRLVISLAPPPGYTWSLPSRYLCRSSSPLFPAPVSPSDVFYPSVVIGKADGISSWPSNILLPWTGIPTREANMR